MRRSHFRIVLLAVLALIPSYAHIAGQEGKKSDPAATLPAVVQASETVRVFAPMSGMLVQQMVQVGDRVKAGQVLGTLDTAEFEGQLKRDQAALARARAETLRAKAGIRAAEATLEYFKLAAAQAEASLHAATAQVRYRDLQLKRMDALAKSGAVDAKSLEEAKEVHDTAARTEASAKTAAESAKAKVAGIAARVEQAMAELHVAEAGVSLAQGQIERSQAHLQRARLLSPLDGVVAQRGYSVGELIRSSDNRGNDPPLFVVQRMDVVRVVAALPERLAAFVQAGDAAEVEFDALPGKKITAKISRVTPAVDSKSRSIRIEFDLPNPTGQLLPGMNGKVVIATKTKG